MSFWIKTKTHQCISYDVSSVKLRAPKITKCNIDVINLHPLWVFKIQDSQQF